MKLSRAGAILLFMEELRTGHKVALGALGVAGTAALAHHYGYQAGSAGGGSVGRDLWKGAKEVGSAVGSTAKDIGSAVGNVVGSAGSWVGKNPAKIVGGLGAAAYYTHMHGGLGKMLATHQQDLSDVVGQTKNVVKGVFSSTKGAPGGVASGIHNYLTREAHAYHAARAANFLSGSDAQSGAYYDTTRAAKLLKAAKSAD